MLFRLFGVGMDSQEFKRHFPLQFPIDIQADIFDSLGVYATERKRKRHDQRAEKDPLRWVHCGGCTVVSMVPRLPV